MERTGCLARLKGFIGCLCLAAGALCIQRDNGIKRRIFFSNPFQKIIDQIDGFDLTGPDRFGGLCCSEYAEFVHGYLPDCRKRIGNLKIQFSSSFDVQANTCSS